MIDMSEFEQEFTTAHTSSNIVSDHEKAIEFFDKFKDTIYRAQSRLPHMDIVQLFSKPGGCADCFKASIDFEHKGIFYCPTCGLGLCEAHTPEGIHNCGTYVTKLPWEEM
jgi:hypothetical protein